MNSSRTRQVLLTLLASLAIASFGCKKEEGEGKDKAAEGKGGEEGAAKEGKEGDKGAAKGGAPSKTSFAVFPKDSEFVLGLNADSLRGSGLYKKFGPMLEAQLSQENEYQSFKDTCGFDPIQKVKSVIIGGTMEGDDGVVVVKGFDKSEAKDCAEKVAKKEGEDLKIEVDGKVMKVDNKGEVMWLGWLDDSTMLTGAGAEGDDGKAWVESRLSGKGGLDGNEDMMGLLGQVDSGGTVWFIAKPKDTSKMAMMGPSPEAMFGTVLLGTGLKADMGMRYSSADDAKKFVEQTQQMMGAMSQDPTSKMIADKTKMEAKGNDAIVKLDLNEDELNKVIGMVQQMMGQFMR